MGIVPYFGVAVGEGNFVSQGAGGMSQRAGTEQDKRPILPKTEKSRKIFEARNKGRNHAFAIRADPEA